MKVLSIDEYTENKIWGYVDDGTNYKEFELRLDGKVEFGVSRPKKDFIDLAHFAGVIGKFDPYAFVLAEPIEVQELNFEELMNVLRRDKRFQWGGGERH